MTANVQCYNKGCGQKFDPSTNTCESCIYHPGPPYFHDAYKIWKCCDKKSTDFSTWLSYKGCTKGFHNGEKPMDVTKAVVNNEIRPEKPEEIIVWNGLNKPADRSNDSTKRELVQLKVEVSDAALKAINEYNESNSKIYDDKQSLMGAVCKNSSCKATFMGTDADQGVCYHHPGSAIFHEGMKYWSCCQKKTSNFSAFLDQAGCESGVHCWTKSERVEKVREDWFSRLGFIHLNIYCKGALPEKCVFESNSLSLNAKVIHSFGEKESLLKYELWGETVPSESRVVIGERKIEIILKQASPDGWPKLLFDKKMENA